MSKNNSSLQQIILDFIEYCEIDRGLSPATAMKYDYRLSQFLVWAQNQLKKKDIRLPDLTVDLIRKFRLFLSRKELNQSTIYNYMVALRSFLKFLVKNDYKSVEPVKIELGKYNPSRNIKYLTGEQLEELLDKPNTTNTTGIRDRAILELLFSTGLRVSELAALDRSKVDIKNREFSIIGKGRRRRVVFLSETAAEWIKKYLERRNDKYIPLFLHYSGKASGEEEMKAYSAPGSDEIYKGVDKPAHMTTGPTGRTRITGQPGSQISAFMAQDIIDPEGNRYRLSVRSIQRLVKKYVKMAGLSVDATPHTLRHSLATDLLGAGADLRSIQEILGHKNVSTTQIYTHLTNLQLRKTHQQYHSKWRK